MLPNIVLNWPAIIVSIIAAFMFGGLWYGPLMGKAWAKAMGMSFDCKPDAATMRKSMIFPFPSSPHWAPVKIVFGISEWGKKVSLLPQLPADKRKCRAAGRSVLNCVCDRSHRSSLASVCLERRYRWIWCNVWVSKWSFYLGRLLHPTTTL